MKRKVPVARPAALAMVVLAAGTGCISSQVVVPGVELRSHAAELIRNGSAEASDRNGRRVTLSVNDAQVREALAGCQTPGQLGFDERETRCRIKDTDEVTFERVDVGKSVALWAGALLVATVTGIVVGAVVDANRSRRMTAPK